MTKDKNKLAISAAKLYYQSDFSQADIAQELQISRPSVSRLLQYAKDQGFVRIEIFDPIEDQSHLSRKLAHAYELKRVIIANAPIENEEDIKRYIGRKGAEYLSSVVKDGDIIGVGWGTTMHYLSHSLTPHELKGAQIVQLEGGITLSASETYATEILERFASNYKTVAQSLPLPVLFDSKEVRNMVKLVYFHLEIFIVFAHCPRFVLFIFYLSPCICVIIYHLQGFKKLNNCHAISFLFFQILNVFFAPT